MPIIPLLIEPEKDELMISYLWRLAQHNGLDHVTDLLNGYIWPNKKSIRKCNQYVRADANNVFRAFYQAVDLPIDPVKFYLDHTLYKGIVPLIPDGVHMQIVTHAFHNEDNIASLAGVPGYMIDEFRVCPCCQKEDAEAKGFWYYHAFHHMPGVAMCAKHCEPLHVLKLSSKKQMRAARLFDANNIFQIKSEPNQEWAHRYATFAASLFDAKIDTDIPIVHQAILNTLKAWGIYDDTKKLLHCIHDAGCNAITDEQIVKSVKYTMHGYINPQFILILSLMVLCFPTTRDFQNALDAVPQNHVDLDRFLSLISGQYDIVGDFYRPLLEMVKRDTGEHFLTTLKGFNYGWRENSADVHKSSKEKFKELFQNATDGSYHLLSDFKSTSQMITVSHDRCGREYQIQPNSFLFIGRRCFCERSYTPEEVRKIVEQHKGFKLLDYSMGKHKSCTILHDSCGRTFKVPLTAFMKTPKCRHCEIVKDHSKENIEQHVEDLVGDEYTVIETEGKSCGKITLRHNVCGKEHTYLSSYFIAGARCPYCNSYAKEDNFRQYVSEVSNGKYKIGKYIRHKDKYEIIDTETNEVRFFTRRRILQELTRPTSSPILPLSVKHPSNALKTHCDIVWEYLVDHYGPDDYICSNEIPIFKETSVRKVFEAINLLCTRKKKLFIIYRGYHSIYAFKDVHLTPEEITEVLYIKRNRIRYGCIRGKTLAYELGIISEKPKTTYIMTNIFQCGVRAYHSALKDSDTSLIGVPILITEENYRTLQFIDLCYETKCFGWGNAHLKIAEFAKTHGVLMSKVNEYLPHYKPRIQEFVKQMIEEMKL